MSASGFRPDPDYWDKKLAHYLHDPPDKALDLRGHEERSRRLRELLHLPAPDEGLWQRADVTAAGLDRAWLPGYDPDPRKSGAVDFLQDPRLTHPLSRVPALEISRPVPYQGEIFSRLQSRLEEELTRLEEAFASDPSKMTPARFHLVHHALREILAQDPQAGLGGLWHRLPADTRIPDHSIWQHCALVSALCACYAESPQKRASLLVFSITPVQDFLIRARKLRDFWTGSLLLSWLAFEGLRQVIYCLGSDHVLYPSLIGQPLVNGLLSRECAIPAAWLTPQPEDVGGVASLPNKFVCLVATGQEGEVADKITQGIRGAWEELGKKTLELVTRLTQKTDSYLEKQFARQIHHFWDLCWAAVPLLEDKDKNAFSVLLPQGVWQTPWQFRDKAQALNLKHSGLTRGEEGFYGPSHALVQSFLAAGKTRREETCPPEQGIKCDLHGDLEILRYKWNGADKNPRPARDPFWARDDRSPETAYSLKAKWRPVSDFKDSERLSAVGLAKRVAYRVIQKMGEHPLKPYFTEAEGFPSTTEVALSDWLDRVAKLNPENRLGKNWRRDLANFLHDQEPEVAPGEQEAGDLDQDTREHCREILDQMAKLKDPPRHEDRYLAILVMDGDRLGRLISGKAVGAAWKSVIHPDVTKRLQESEIPHQYREFWQEFLSTPRLLAPQVHAALSEALADFSIHTVPEIIRKANGRLIYAGGDDVCAVLPVSRAVPAARELAKSYGQAFLFHSLGQNQPLALGNGPWQPQPGRLLLHLGPNHTISGAILICHHKKPLAGALRRAQELLKKEAKSYGRNALAVELERRGGGARRFVCFWEEKPWPGLNLPGNLGTKPLLELFLELADTLGNPDNLELSTSLLYRLEELRPGLEALAQGAPQELVTFLAKQVWRSRRGGGETSEEKEERAQHQAQKLAAVAIRGVGKDKIQTEPLVVARFIGLQRWRAGLGGEVDHE